MSVVVIATFTPKEGRVQEVLDALADSVPLVHQEPGCELYSVYTNDKVVVMVERWADGDALKTHGTSDTYKAFSDRIEDALDGRPTVVVSHNVPLGDPAKGTIH